MLQDQGMSDSRSDTLVHSVHKSAEQFDYFMIGLLSAVVAYYAKEFTPEPLSSVSYDLLLGSFLMLLVSLYFGLIRIEAVLTHKRLNAEILSSFESRGKQVKALGEMGPGQKIINTETGQIYDTEGVARKIKEIDARLPALEKAIENADKRTLFSYKWRNFLFIWGFIVLVLAKILKPYLG
jgi:hypothetical protein